MENISVEDINFRLNKLKENVSKINVKIEENIKKIERRKIEVCKLNRQNSF